MRIVAVAMVAALLLGCTDTLPTSPSLVEGEASIEVQAEKRTVPASRPLIADMKLWFNTGYYSNPTSPNYYGTLKTNGEEYGMITYHLGSGKPFGDDNLRGNAFFAYDRVELYSWITFDAATQELTVGEHLMTMYDHLVFRWKQNVATSHGRVAEAYGEFAMWVGSPTKSEGHFVWSESGLPLYSEGTYMLR